MFFIVPISVFCVSNSLIGLFSRMRLNLIKTHLKTTLITNFIIHGKQWNELLKFKLRISREIAFKTFSFYFIPLKILVKSICMFLHFGYETHSFILLLKFKSLTKLFFLPWIKLLSSHPTKKSFVICFWCYQLYLKISLLKFKGVSIVHYIEFVKIKLN